jgi:hypothetical protein
LRLYLCGVAVLAPLKLGSAIGPAEIPLWPASLLEWVFGSWPPFLLGALAGVGLLWAVGVCRGSLAQHPAWRVLWVWLGLLAGCAPGLVRTAERDYAVTFVLYLSGVSAFLAAVLLLTAADASARHWLGAAIAAGTLLCSLSGWYQRLWGFAEMRRYMEAQVRETGRAWNGALQGKVLQTRVHRPFFHPNSYAAHLVLTGPLTLLLLWRAGRQVQPKRLSQWLFVSTGAALVGGSLVMSQSRGAQLAVGGGVGLALLGFRPLRRWRWLLLAVAVAAGGAAMLAVNAGRDLVSASARMDYWRAALRICMDQPWTGAGLGEFLNAYVRLKPLGAEETRAAHNLVLEMLSQCGLLGGLAGLLCALLPVWLSLRRPAAGAPGDDLLAAAAVAGLGAWVLHALLDFNLQIPPTVALAAVLPVFCWPADGSSPSLPAGRAQRLLLVFLGGCAVLALWRVPGERAFRRLGDSLARTAARDAAVVARQAARWLSLSPEPLAMYGKELLAQGEPAAAASALGLALVRAPHRSALYAWRAEAALRSGDLASAEAAARQAWERYPWSARAALLTGLVALLKSGAAADVGEARAWLAAGLSCQPGFRLDAAGVAVVLAPVPGDASPRYPVADLCRRLTALGLRQPGATAAAGPVGFRPEPEAP